MDDPRKKLTKARWNLLKDQPFFGHLSLVLEPVEVKDLLKKAAGPMATDGVHLYYDPDWLLSIPLPVLQGVVCHETLHCAMKHMTRQGSRDNKKWNIATDLAINPIVKDAGMQLMEGVLYDAGLHGKSAEEIYSLIKTVRIKCPGGCSGKDHEHADQGQADYELEYGRSGSGKCTDDHGAWKKPGQENQEDGGEKPDWMKPLPGNLGGRQMEEKWRDAVAKAAEVSKRKGKLPAGLERLVKEIMHPKLPWRQVLAEFITPAPFDFMFAPPDRRMAHTGFVMPDLTGDKVEDVIIGVDNSGSISQEEMTEFIAEVLGILQSYDMVRGYIAFCDAAVHSFIEVDQDTSPSEIIAANKGGGGTSFIPVFNEVKERGINPSCMVYLTDTYGDFPPEQPGYPVLWVVKGDGEVPWGRKCQL